MRRCEPSRAASVSEGPPKAGRHLANKGSNNYSLLGGSHSHARKRRERPRKEGRDERYWRLLLWRLESAPPFSKRNLRTFQCVLFESAGVQNITTALGLRQRRHLRDDFSLQMNRKSFLGTLWANYEQRRDTNHIRNGNALRCHSCELSVKLLLTKKKKGYLLFLQTGAKSGWIGWLID